MAIDPQSLQILGMVLDRQQRSQEGEAQRGHEVNMTNLNVAQRNLENQISMNFQRQQNAESQLNNLKNTFMSMGIEPNKFGSDSQLGEMAERIGGSLINQSESLEELTSAQISELDSLRSMGSAFTRGQTVASKYQASFDEDFNIDPESDFGAFNLNVGNEDEMARLFAERDVDLSDDPRELHAFIQGASSVFSNTAGVLEKERARMDTVNSRAQADAARLQEANLDLANFSSRHELSNQIGYDPTGLISGDLMLLASEETPKKEKTALQKNMKQRIIAGSDSFSRTIASQSGINLDDILTKENDALSVYDSIEKAVADGYISQEEAQTAKYFRDVQASYQENAMKHINSLTSNTQSFVNGITDSGKELERALEEYDTVENAIANQALAPTDLGNILAFVGNPFINSTMAGGFHQLNDIMRRSKAQEELRQNTNPSTATAKADEAFQSRTAINVGQRLATVISDNLFDTDLSGEGGNGLSDLGTEEFLRNAEEVFAREPEVEEREPIKNYDPNVEYRPDNAITRTIRSIKNKMNASSNEREKITLFTRELDRLESIKNQMDSGDLNSEQMTKASFDYIRLSRLLSEQEDVIESLKSSPTIIGGISKDKMLYDKYLELTGQK